MLTDIFSPSTTSAASTKASTYSAVTPTYTPLDPCPDANNTQYTSTQPKDQSHIVSGGATLNFTRYCNVNSPFDSSSTSAAKKLSEAFVYSLDDCIEICASLNFWGNNKDCTVVVYDVKGSRPGNCWVGSANGVKIGESQGEDGLAVAVLDT